MKIYTKSYVLIIFLFAIIAINFSSVTYAAISNSDTNNAFRDDVMRFVKQVAANGLENQVTPANAAMDEHWYNGGHLIINWAMSVSMYSNGKLIGMGATNEKSLSRALIKATIQALETARFASKSFADMRFKITFYYPPDARQYSIVDHGDKSAELIGNISPVRVMDTPLLKERILAQKAYLLRMMDPEMHAFFKRYNPKTDEREKSVRTIYSASSLFTLLEINSAFPDPVIESLVVPIGDFLLMMQEKSGENAGAFHYSYDKITREKDSRFVVGTASKTIFTLLLLNERTRDPKYLNAAVAAGNWLMTKVDADGRVNPVVRYSANKKKLIQLKKQSFLYSGQVLSALSRLYKVTRDKKYYDTATLIANRFVKHAAEKGAFVGDDFRSPNSVSTSWMVMSLTDYAKVNRAQVYRKAVTRSSAELVARQASDEDDAFNNGRVVDLISASGNGWLNEVMTVLYPFCKKERMQNCESYKQFIVNSSRWLVQNVYTPVNSFSIKNPANADGGAIPNFLGKIVRTDAVCHGGNSLVGLLKIAGPKDQVYKSLPEMPFEQVLTLLGIGLFPEIGNSKGGVGAQ